MTGGVSTRRQSQEGTAPILAVRSGRPAQLLVELTSRNEILG